MRTICAALLCLASVTVSAQQVADTLFLYEILKPGYPQGKGPLILLDEGHHNFHTTTGRYMPFSDFLRRDGYVVKGLSERFTADNIKPARVLVIANALHERNDSDWSLPTPSAFMPEEIGAVAHWVKQGGSLFLIADHMPFPGAAEDLAAAFGFTLYNGFAMRKQVDDPTIANALTIPDIFTPGKGLGDHFITRGRNQAESITSVRTFTGEAFSVPDGATPLIVLDDSFELLMSQVAWQFDKDCEKLPAKGLVQGACMDFGKGRIVVFGEAAMFSAQIQGGKTRMGMNAPDAKQNPQFLLNIIHWLDRLDK